MNMTIRQISEVAGCNIKTVREMGKRMFPMVKQIKKGYPIEYTEKQVKSIMDKLPKRNYIADPTHLGTPSPTQMGTPIEMALIQLVDQNTKMMAMMITRMDSLESKQKEQVLLPAPQIGDREQLNKLVRDYATNKLDGNYQQAYRELYSQILYRLKTNVKVKAKNEGIKTMDYLDREGLIPTCISIMIELSV